MEITRKRKAVNQKLPYSVHIIYISFLGFCSPPFRTPCIQLMYYLGISIFLTYDIGLNTLKPGFGANSYRLCNLLLGEQST